MVLASLRTLITITVNLSENKSLFRLIKCDNIQAIREWMPEIWFFGNYHLQNEFSFGCNLNFAQSLEQAETFVTTSISMLPHQSQKHISRFTWEAFLGTQNADSKLQWMVTGWPLGPQLHYLYFKTVARGTPQLFWYNNTKENSFNGISNQLARFIASKIFSGLRSLWEVSTTKTIQGVMKIVQKNVWKI